MEEDDEFKGMDKCVCPRCGHDEFIRIREDSENCRVWYDGTGYHDEVTHSDDDPRYDFTCGKCSCDCSGPTKETQFKVVKVE